MNFLLIKHRRLVSEAIQMLLAAVALLCGGNTLACISVITTDGVVAVGWIIGAIALGALIFRRFQLHQMPQTRGRIRQYLVRPVDLRKLRRCPGDIRMLLGRNLMVFRLEPLRIQPGPGWLSEQGEQVCHIVVPLPWET